MIKYINFTLYKDNRREQDHKNIKAVYNDNSYSFLLDKVKTKLNDNNFSRENEEFLFNIDLINKTASYLLKEKNTTFDIEVEDLILSRESDRIVLEYKISSDEEKFKIILEENKNE